MSSFVNIKQAICMFSLFLFISLSISCGCNNPPNRKILASTSTFTKIQPIVELSISTKPETLKDDKKTFNLLIQNNSTSTIVLSDYILKIGLTSRNSKLLYTDENSKKNEFRASNIPLIKLTNEKQLMKGKTITIPLTLEVDSEAKQENIKLSLYSTNNNITISSISWKLTPIINKSIPPDIDKMIQNIEHNQKMIFSKDFLIDILKEIKAGNINTINKKNTNNQNCTALHTLVRLGEEDITQLLIDQGADLEAKEDNGYTALHDAANYGNAKAIDQLLKAGANIEVKDNQGRTPLYEAVTSTKPGKIASIELLLKKTNNTQIKDKQGQTPLHAALIIKGRISAPMNDYLKIIELLLKTGFDPNVRDKTGNTPLHYAAKINFNDNLYNATEKDENEIYNLLKNYSADETIKNTEGKTPVDIVKEKK